MKEMCMEGQRSEKHIFFCTQTQAGVSLSVHYFCDKGIFLHVSVSWLYWLARIFCVFTYWRCPPYWLHFRSKILKKLDGARLLRDEP